jgi:hypothetical protein
MEPIIRAATVYLFLLLVFRISGKRTLAETSSFDLVLLLIISETTQQAMVDNDHSMTNAASLILTLVGLDVLLSFIKQWFPTAEAWLDGLPLIILRLGKPIQSRINRERVDEAEGCAREIRDRADRRRQIRGAGKTRRHHYYPATSGTGTSSLTPFLCGRCCGMESFMAQRPQNPDSSAWLAVARDKLRFHQKQTGKQRASLSEIPGRLPTRCERQPSPHCGAASLPWQRLRFLARGVSRRNSLPKLRAQKRSRKSTAAWSSTVAAGENKLHPWLSQNRNGPPW